MDRLFKRKPSKELAWTVALAAAVPLARPQGVPLPNARPVAQQKRSLFARGDKKFRLTASSHGEDLIVTPFAQVLASLRNVRNNFISITNVPNKSKKAGQPPTTPRRPPLHSVPLPDEAMRVAADTLEELDWCLEQLETIQTHRSVSEMASTKFRKMLNKELSHFAESSKSGTQISQFIINTYMDKEDAELDIPTLQVTLSDGSAHQPSTSSSSTTEGPTQMAHGVAGGTSLLNKAKTVAMSHISGVRKLKHANSVSQSGELSKYGIDVANPRELARHMDQLDRWGPDIFKIGELSGNHALTTCTYTILKERGLIKSFSLVPATLVTYLLHVEHHYRDNPYHNAIHGADVAQSMHVLMSSQALSNVFTDLEVLAAIIAGAVHDCDHPGFTNPPTTAPIPRLPAPNPDRHCSFALRPLLPVQMEFLLFLSESTLSSKSQPSLPSGLLFYVICRQFSASCPSV
uniref:3',5'-cyclic-AMP phosphodiesterase n=1 Tax=Plectus sambesii TaxID=2011161 RepID=A0A914VIU2_9BILA